jgi:glycosyltransferase involved in cell wall biosynthesis
VQRLGDDPALARRLGEAGRRRLREQFSWPAIVQRWLDLYAGLVTRSR